MTDTDAEVIRLHPEPQPEATVAPPPVEVEGDDAGKRLAIIPEHWRPGNARATARMYAGLQAHRIAYHGIRLHWYLFVTCWYALIAVALLAGQLAAWWGWFDGKILESEAVASGRPGHADAMRAHTEGKKTRKSRGQIVLACALVTGLALAVAAWYLPGWAWVPLGAAAVLVLARLGQPDGKPIIRAAIVPPRYEPPTPAIITRALGSLAIPQINAVLKDGASGLNFVTDPYKDGEGWGCDLDLPHGVTPKMILQRREQFASALRRPLSAVWPEGVPEVHEGRMRVWVGFTDISKARPHPWPLLRAGQADVFAGLPFATDPRGRRIDVPMFEVNWLIGASPGQGKTAAVRVLACGAALDPVADLWIHEHSGKGDLEPLARVCHRYTSGLDDEAIGYAAASLKMLRRELDKRSAEFKKLPKDARPEGKVTRELARRHRKLRPLICVIDEAQNLFMHPELGAQAADDAAYVIRLGRAYGIIVILATQRPDKDSLPTAIRGIVTARFCLKVPDQDGNDMILGTGSYKAGYRSTIFRAKTDAGLGWLKGDGDPQIARTYYLDERAAVRVADRARAMREQAGVLSGYALGQEDAEAAPRDVLADVLAVFGEGESGLHWQVVADRLAERFPGRWADAAAEAVSAECRQLGVPSVGVKVGGVTLKGCRTRDVTQALEGA